MNDLMTVNYLKGLRSGLISIRKESNEYKIRNLLEGYADSIESIVLFIQNKIDFEN